MTLPAWRWRIVATAALVLLGLSATATANAAGPGRPRPRGEPARVTHVNVPRAIDGQYIVVFRDDATRVDMHSARSRAANAGPTCATSTRRESSGLRRHAGDFSRRRSRVMLHRPIQDIRPDGSGIRSDSQPHVNTTRRSSSTSRYRPLENSPGEQLEPEDA